MPINPEDNLKTLHFREIHPLVLIGTASDRYAGWIGQIYSKDRYEGQLTKRSRIWDFLRQLPNRWWQFYRR